MKFLLKRLLPFIRRNATFKISNDYGSQKTKLRVAIAGFTILDTEN
jgi:hypothetical protein